MTSPFDHEIREKLATIDLSLETKQFLASRVGRYLTRRAAAHVEIHNEQLKSMDILADPKAATKVQMEIKLGECFMYWLAELLNEGNELTQELIAEERTNAGLDPDGAPHGEPQH